MSAWVLIIMASVSGGMGYRTGVSIASVPFADREACISAAEGVARPSDLHVWASCYPTRGNYNHD